MSMRARNKKLSDMSLAELWALFPVILAEHRSEWSAWFAEEKSALMPLLPDGAQAQHIGSTAIDGIKAKPIIDILVELPHGVELRATAERLRAAGYIIMNASDARVSLNKGYTERGYAERVFHVHMQYETARPSDEALFRDYLITHPTVAAEYERLKVALRDKFEHDRDGYTAAKSEFVKGCVEAAKTELGQRE